jgi:DNA polymerase IIIc chi subunit
MNTEITFYEVEEDLYKSIALLLYKIWQDGKKSLLFFPDQNQLNELDAFLWSFARNKFLPHCTVLDVQFNLEHQPILLSHLPENINNADVLLFLQPPSNSFIANFQKACYFFMAKQSQNHNLTPKQHFYKKADKWQKIA